MELWPGLRSCFALACPYKESNLEDDLINKIKSGTLETKKFQKKYCILLYQRFGTYQDVARRTGLDRRTVKKYILNGID